MSLELNKIAASILTAGVVAMGSGFIAEMLVHPEMPEEPVYKVASKDGGGKDGGAKEPAEPTGPEPIKPLLADADPEAGRSAMQACAACHSFEKGGPNKVGPNLYGVVGNKIASHEGFGYSDALSSKEGEWTYEKLNAYLANPQEWAPGTNMSYPGIKDRQKRANVVAWLRQNDDEPMPLPTAEEVAQAEQAGAEGESAGGEQAEDKQAGGEQAEDKQAGGEQAGDQQMAKAEGDGGGEAAGGALGKRLANASASEGKAASQVCAACHSFEQGGPHKVGPNLYDVVGKDIASKEGYSYSDALKGKEGVWTYAKLDKYLKNPNSWAPGNKMTYPGVKDDAKRADIVMYLAEQSEDPPAIPGSGGKAAGGDGADQKAEASGGGETATGGGDKAADDGAQQAGGAGEQQAADAGQAGETQQAKATGGGDSGGAAGGNPLHKKIAAADPSAGKSASQVCVACHSFEQGGPNKVGPNLYNVVGTDIAGKDDYSYSDALKGKDGAWTYAKLDKYLENPNGWAPGNKMTYPGVKDESKRMAVIAYLRQFADNPPELNTGGAGGEQKSEAEDGAQKSGAGGAADEDQAKAGDAQSDQADAGDSGSGDRAGETQQAKATDGGQAAGGSEDGGQAAGGSEDGPSDPLLKQIASADPAAGKSAAQVCSACHSFEQGGPNKVGPNLYDVVGADIASHEGYSYSDALKGKDGAWTYAKLDKYLKNPNGWAPGNKMTYPGVKDDAKRAAVIAYLRQYAENPPPLK